MNRLTRTAEAFDYCRDYCGEGDCQHKAGVFPAKCLDATMYERLRDYEDTGLEPEEIKKANSVMVSAFNLAVNSGTEMLIGRLKEIIRAEAEGRLLILPCKVGDTVYRIQFGFDFEQGATEIGVYDVPFATIYLPEVGKTVFLTQEEAEAALSGGADG
jgi:hypothetical protein